MCKSGFRSISKLVSYLNKKLNWGLEKIPCANTIENWVKKSGYCIYNKKSESESEQSDYALIIDESMMLGSEKMMLSLSIPVQKISSEPTKYGYVKVLDISVRSKWNSENIKEIFNRTEERHGKSPSYIVSDNDSKLVKAMREQSCIHIRDISHSLALHVEKLYKNDADFQAMTKSISQVKIREVRRPTSYLLPPRQRTIARFM